MKIFHTADWHLGKLIQGIYMTEDQRLVLEQFTQAVCEEKPDVVIIAGDLYDRAVPPTEAVALLDDTLKKIVIDFKIPVIAIAGNHDSPGRLHFGSQIMRANGLHIIGHLSKDPAPIILKDQDGEVHFHLVPYMDPSIVRHLYEEDEVRNHNDAMRTVIENIQSTMNPKARHVLIGHAFVTPFGDPEENTSDSERPLAIGGAEHVDSRLFEAFHYTALGHLHQAHHVGDESIRYSGSPMKYSISEEYHQKGFLIVHLDNSGNVTIEKRELIPLRDMRTIEGTLGDILTHTKSDDYVFVKLLDQTPVLSPMEKIRSVYPNAMHVERKLSHLATEDNPLQENRQKMDDLSLFKAFYQEVSGQAATDDMTELFQDVLNDVIGEER